MDEKKFIHEVRGFYKADFAVNQSERSTAVAFSIVCEPFLRAVGPSCNQKLQSPKMAVLENGLLAN